MLSVPGDRAALRRQLDLAWEGFISRGELDGVRPEIARSWTRARDVYRIDPGLKRVPVLPEDAFRRRCEQDDVLELARPVLDQLGAGLRGSGHVVALFDAEGWLLHLTGDHAAADGLAELAFLPGACWAEASAGTCGPGTALAQSCHARQ